MDLAARAAQIRILLLDVDGILTDNGLYVGESGELMKRFDVRDGVGIKLVMRAGLEVGLISGHDSQATAQRARQLGIACCHVGVKDKRPVWEAILAERDLVATQALYMGDDLLDIALLQRAGLAVTVPEAPEIVRRHAHLVTTAPGGRGAVREVCERLLFEQGRLEDCLERFV
ncbi:MAG: HAD-IIIA family hydrolase [Planctomycetes bacterium]|nr:HAD-IIIA family hydrolase [Planctomycetota bacterium]